MTKTSAVGGESVERRCPYMSLFLAAHELRPRGEGRGAAADEATRLDAHENRNSDLVCVEEHVDLRGQTHVGQHKRSEAFQASHWSPTESHISPCKQALSASDRHAQSRGGERRMGQGFENVRAPEHPQRPSWSQMLGKRPRGAARRKPRSQRRRMAPSVVRFQC